MPIDLLIILAYFGLILVIGWRSRSKASVSAEEYFISSRSLKWPSVALSTIATNIHAGHFLGMAGSAYALGLAQANFEINAILGILVAVFFFIPLFLRAKVITITQYIEKKCGPQVALLYSTLMLLLYALLYLGGTLFWGAYAIQALFGEHLHFISTEPAMQIGFLIVVLGIFSATYTYFGGLTAVVRTDIAQFVLLLGGGVLLTYLSIDRLGGWSQLYAKSSTLMHLHLPSSHPTIPWTALLGMNLLNLNYWGANQIILQRALAAKSLRHAQVGLLVGGLLKYLMAAIIVIPGIALVGILGSPGLSDPDQTYTTLVKMLLPTGLRGVVLCGLFASLMSSVDSIYNSLSTIWSIDIYKRYLKPNATDAEIVRMGKRAILGTLCTGLLFGFFFIYAKFQNPDFPLTHWFNDMSYYVKNGFVVMILAAVFLKAPAHRLVLWTMIGSIPLTVGLKFLYPGLAYMNRSAVAILMSFAIIAVPTILKKGWRMRLEEIFSSSNPTVGWCGVGLFASLVFTHIVLH